jgi:hypothetical protein
MNDIQDSMVLNPDVNVRLVSYGKKCSNVNQIDTKTHFVF